MNRGGRIPGVLAAAVALAACRRRGAAPAGAASAMAAHSSCRFRRPLRCRYTRVQVLDELSAGCRGGLRLDHHRLRPAGRRPPVPDDQADCGPAAAGGSVHRRARSRSRCGCTRLCRTRPGGCRSTASCGSTHSRSGRRRTASRSPSRLSSSRLAQFHTVRPRPREVRSSAGTTAPLMRRLTAENCLYRAHQVRSGWSRE